MARSDDQSVAAELGINPETLRNWVRAAGASRPRGRRTQEPAQPPTSREAESAALRKKVCELEEEREILRKAAKHFRGLRRGVAGSWLRPADRGLRAAQPR
ncbi:transposase [Streptomyces sp. NPDC058463]|uniref:transposase n=1 Tax=Streptomyces sp. NPDC058463 TaxID=3346510 RepID=UPI003669405D